MTKLSIAVCALLTVLLRVTQVRSEDDALPKNMIDLLKPGMLVGIRSVEGTANVRIDVYSEDQYEIARDVVAPPLNSQRIVPSQKGSSTITSSI